MSILVFLKIPHTLKRGMSPRERGQISHLVTTLQDCVKPDAHAFGPHDQACADWVHALLDAGLFRTLEPTPCLSRMDYPFYEVDLEGLIRQRHAQFPTGLVVIMRRAPSERLVRIFADEVPPPLENDELLAPLQALVIFHSTKIARRTDLLPVPAVVPQPVS